MSPRRADKTDEQILAETVRIVRRYGPRVTLTRIGAEVGLTPARLIQRFGSRDQLLTAAESWADRRMHAAIFADLDTEVDPLGALVDRLAAVAERNARRLYLLSNSYLFDPGHLAAASGAREAKRREAEYLRDFQRILDRAVAAGQLIPTDTARLARAVFVTWIGTYTVWAYAPDDSLRRLIEQDLLTLFAPYRATARTARQRRPAPAHA